MSRKDWSCATEDKAKGGLAPPPPRLPLHPYTVKHSAKLSVWEAVLLKQTLGSNPAGRGGCWRSQQTPRVYTEQPVSVKRTEHDPSVFVTPANPTKR